MSTSDHPPAAPAPSSDPSGSSGSTGDEPQVSPAPIELPWQRLNLPGPRWLWWLVCTAALASVLTLAESSRGGAADRAATVRYQLRFLDMAWRATTWLGLDARPAAKTPAKTRESATAHLSLVEGPDAKAALQDLLATAMRLDTEAAQQPPTPAKPAAIPLADEVVAHCVAFQSDAIAAALAVQLPAWSTELQVALTALPADVTPALGDRARTLPPAKWAAEQSRAAAFARPWSDWVRDRLRLRVAVRAGLAPPPGLAADLLARDRSVAAIVWTVAQLVLLAGFFGISSWLSAWLRAAIARRRGQPRWAWLQHQYPGLPNDNPYLLDPLVPLLALALWLGAQLLASLVVAVPGMQAHSPFAVLLQTMIGLAAAQAAVTWLSPTRVPLLHAARLGGDPAIPLLRASTAALRALAALLPVMLLVSVVAAVLVTDADRVHPVASLGLGRGDAVSLIVLGAAAVLVGPLAEELLFRGLIYRPIRQRYGRVAGLVASSLLFSLMHVAPGEALQYATLGLAFALTYEWVGSLWASVILHALWNLGSFLLLACVVQS